MKKLTVDREYKNNLFAYLFSKIKKYALSLYNAVNRSNYTNEEDLQFVEVVRRNSETMDINEAMVAAISECLETGILVEFLQEYGKELEEMCWERYDTERILQIQHEEALEDAREEGRAEGRAEGRSEAEQIILLLKQERECLKRQLTPKVQ